MAWPVSIWLAFTFDYGTLFGFDLLLTVGTVPVCVALGLEGATTREAILCTVLREKAHRVRGWLQFAL